MYSERGLFIDGAWRRTREIAAITPFTTDDEVYARANDSVYGLSAHAFTRSPARAREAVARIQSGMVGINSLRSRRPRRRSGA